MLNIPAFVDIVEVLQFNCSLIQNKQLDSACVDDELFTALWHFFGLSVRQTKVF